VEVGLFALAFVTTLLLPRRVTYEETVG